jgi:hypothetical protein
LFQIIELPDISKKLKPSKSLPVADSTNNNNNVNLKSLRKSKADQKNESLQDDNDFVNHSNFIMSENTNVNESNSENKRSNNRPRHLVDAGTITDTSSVTNDQRNFDPYLSKKTKRSIRNKYYISSDESEDDEKFQRKRRPIDLQIQIPNTSIEVPKATSSIIAENFMDRILCQKIEHMEGDFERSLQDHNAALILSRKRCESEIEISKYNAETNRLVILKEIRNAETEIAKLKEKSWCTIQ